MVMNVVTRVVPKALNYGYRAVKASPYVIFGDGAQILTTGITRGIKASTSKSMAGTLWQGLKRGGKGLEASIAHGPGILGNITKCAKALPGAVKSGWTSGMAAAKAAGKSGLWGAIKGAGSGVTKAIPGIGNVVMALASLPTIYSAFKDDGFLGGLTETLKEGSKLAGGAVGAAIGSAFGPIGTAVGWMAGNWLTSLVTGKTHLEKKYDPAQQTAQANPQATQTDPTQLQDPILNPQTTQTNPGYSTTNPFSYNYAMNPHENDILFKNMGFDMIG